MTNRTVSPDKLIARIKTLRRRHRDLDARVAEEETRPWPDAHRIKDLKQQRLGLKDAIRVTRQMLYRSGAQPPHFS